MRARGVKASGYRTPTVSNSIDANNTIIFTDPACYGNNVTGRAEAWREA